MLSDHLAQDAFAFYRDAPCGQDDFLLVILDCCRSSVGQQSQAEGQVLGTIKPVGNMAIMCPCERGSKAYYDQTPNSCSWFTAGLLTTLEDPHGSLDIVNVFRRTAHRVSTASEAKHNRQMPWYSESLKSLQPNFEL